MEQWCLNIEVGSLSGWVPLQTSKALSYLNLEPSSTSKHERPRPYPADVRLLLLGQRPSRRESHSSELTVRDCRPELIYKLHVRTLSCWPPSLLKQLDHICPGTHRSLVAIQKGCSIRSGLSILQHAGRDYHSWEIQVPWLTTLAWYLFFFNHV